MGFKRAPRGSLSKLLEDTPEKWYWLGFLFADGHLSMRGRLALSLAKKDKEHLEKFSEYMGRGAGLAAQNRHVAQEL